MKNTGTRLPKGFLSESRFETEAFSCPATLYAPVYTWMWNGAITEQQTDWQLEEMARLGIKRLYILPMPKSFRPTSFPTPLSPEYLSEDFLKAYRYAVHRAKQLGMRLWLYDEGGWPSGGACGQVMLEDPSLVCETLRIEMREIKKGEVYLASENAEAAFLGDKSLLPLEKATEDGLLTEFIRVSSSFPGVNSADYPDITKEGTAPLFISLTLDKFAKALGEDLDAVDAVFTDEPTAPRPFPYTDEIKALFKKSFGRDIEDLLPILFGLKRSEGSEEIKQKFFALLSDLFVDRFLNKEKAWAEKHALSFVGHLDKDDEVNGSVTGGSFSLLKALRAFDVPGVDAIRRQIFSPKGKRGNYGKNGFFPRLASSAAAQNGGRHALSESFAVYGAGLNYDEMRYIVNFQAMCGINVFNYMLIPYERKGYALAGELPHFTEKTTPDLAVFNRYTERLCYLFSLGERCANVALYMPVTDRADGADALSYEALGNELQERRVPFDVVDDGFFSLATRKDGCLTAGRASYATVVLGEVTLPEKTKKALSDFAATGGKVLTTSADIAKTVSGAVSVADLSRLASPLPLKEEGILLSQATTEDGTLFFLMNQTGESKTFSVPLAKKSYWITPTDGKIFSLGKDPVLTLCSGEIGVLYVTERILPAEPLFKPTDERTIECPLFRPVKRRVISDELCEKTLAEDFAPISFGDWKARLGEGFSGTGEYQMTFDLPKVSQAELDLGKVAHAAEVFVNGVSLGTLVMPPYRIPLPGSLLKESNTLLVRVTNTIANEFESTAAFSRYRTWQLGNYLKEERLFHTDSKESGLFGKVKIIYK